MQPRFPTALAASERPPIFWLPAVLQAAAFGLEIYAYGKFGLFLIAMTGLPFIMSIALQVTVSAPVLKGHVAKSDWTLRLGLGLATIAAIIHVTELLLDRALHFEESLWAAATISWVAASLIVFRAIKPFLGAQG